jgi:hypothetical protein
MLCIIDGAVLLHAKSAKILVYCFVIPKAKTKTKTKKQKKKKF